MHTMASKKSGANGSDRASAWIGNTPSRAPASRIRWMFSAALNHRSVAQTCTPNSRCRKIDDAARPQPRSSNRMPGRKSSAVASHSVTHRALAALLALATIHSGWYLEERGNRSETDCFSETMGLSFQTITWLLPNAPNEPRAMVARWPETLGACDGRTPLSLQSDFSRVALSLLD